MKRAITPRLSAIAGPINSNPYFKLETEDFNRRHVKLNDLPSTSSDTMAGLIVGLLHILQKVFCGTGNVDGKPNQGSNDYYNNQQQQQQGFPPLQNNYPPQQGIGRPPQQQNAWNGQHINGQQQNAWNGQHNNGQQQSHGYQQHNNNHQNAPYKASNQANLQRPNYQGPSGLVGGSILGPHSKLVSTTYSKVNYPAHATM